MMKEKNRKEVLEMIKKRLPDKAEIILLSLTGSRAFGWAAENQDYDVHGIFSCEDYWDWVHMGERGYDTNLYELTHTLFDIQYQHFVIFMNFSNPFFLHPKFDYKGFMSFCGLLAVKRKAGDMINQIKRFHYDKSPRTALHAYRIPMVCLHHVETGNMERNIFKLNEKYGFKQLTKLKQVYNKKRGTFDVEQVNKDLAYLQNKFNEKIASFKEEELEVNMEKANEWFNRMKETFYENYKLTPSEMPKFSSRVVT